MCRSPSPGVVGAVLEDDVCREYSILASRWTISYHVKDDAWEWHDDVYAIHGFEPHSVRPTTDLVHASKHRDDLERLREVFSAASRDGGSFAVAYRLLRADGTERQVVLTGYGEPRNGEVDVVHGYYIDLTKDFDTQIREESHRAVLASAEGRATIEQAKGVLMLAYGLDAGCGVRDAVVVV